MAVNRSGVETHGQRASRRIDPTTGIVEEVSFLGDDGNRIFSVLSMPPTQVDGGVVIAPSLLTDRLRMYRDEVAVARRLAERGYAVLRFDYRGFGHSDGETGVATFDGMLADLAVAIEHLQAQIGYSSIWLVGSRFGSLVVANHHNVPERIVLWDPVSTGREYFKAAFRAQMVGNLHGEARLDPPSSQLVRSGYANLLGYRVSRRLVDGVEDAALTSGKWPDGGRILWIESSGELSRARQQVSHQLREYGANLTIRFAPNDDPGWFVGVRPFVNSRATDLLVGWLSEGGRR